MSAEKPRRINVAVTDETIAALELIMAREGVTLTEAVRRLIGYGDFVYRAVKEDGKTVYTRDGGKYRELVLL